MQVLKLMMAAALCLSCPAYGQAPREARVSEIDTLIRAALSKTKARGLALALVEDGQPVLVSAWGQRNAAGDPLTIDTVMYGASLTKAVFGYTVMQLVEEEKNRS